MYVGGHTARQNAHRRFPLHAAVRAQNTIQSLGLSRLDCYRLSIAFVTLRSFFGSFRGFPLFIPCDGP
jgi:hypothetical protein